MTGGLTLTETGSEITINTGPLQFRVKKQNFNLFDEVLINSSQIIAPLADNGGVFTARDNSTQKSSDVASPTVTVEESGPIRAIIKVEAPTLFVSTSNMTHGWIARIYAYAGKTFVKVEFTLKNSAFNAKYSWPLYCEDFSVRTRLNLGAPTITVGRETGTHSQALGSGLYVYQNNYNTYAVKPSDGSSTLASGVKAPGWLDASDGSMGVTVYMRYFWETWPNGIEVDAGKDLYVRMLPKWDAGYYWTTEWTRASFVQSSTGLHWLDDMQHLTKEILYEFHTGGVNASQAAIQAAQFQKNPVGIVPTGWYAQTRVTADLAGILPITSPASSPASTNPEYMTRGANDFGWPNFQGNIIGAVDRKSSCEPGDIPFQAYRFMATENPLYYYQDRAYVYGELNVRPECMGGEVDFAQTGMMEFTTMPYSPAPWCNYSWRPGWGGYGPTSFKIVEAYLSGSGPHGWTSRDLEHGWFYQVEDFYYYDGMPLVKDWYRWMGQFGKIVAYDMGDNRVWRIATRGHGHMMSAFMGAYKMTGDSSFIRAAHHYIAKLRTGQDRTNGQTFNDGGSESPLMVGYLTRGIIRYLEELKSRSCKEYVRGFGMLEGLFQWNYNWANWGYHVDYGQTSGISGTAMPLSDPQIWMYLHTGFTGYKTHTRTFADARIYGDLINWNLSSTNFPVYVGRLCQYAWENTRQDTVPPAAISDLSGQATQPSSGLWCLADSLPANQTIYFAVRSFDSTHNMSALSNVYSVNTGSATTHYLTWTAAPTAAYYHVRWCHKPFKENNASLDTSTHYYFWAGNAVGNDINEPVFTGAENGPSAAQTAVLLSVRPNPFHPVTTVRLLGARGQGLYSVTMTDIRGRQVFRESVSGRRLAQGVQWNAAGRPSGVYFVRVRGGSHILTKRIILAK